MSTNSFALPKGFPTRRVLVAGLILLLGIALSTGFTVMQSDQRIAPPALRIVDGLWRLFI
jgi:hypothetical protein